LSRAPAAATPDGRTPADSQPQKGDASPARRAPTKLSYKEARELAELPARIEALEREHKEITERMSQPEYHREAAGRARSDGARLATIDAELATAFDRWAEIEARVGPRQPG
jgi:ATP-binding cassette subfamily F protein uup